MLNKKKIRALRSALQRVPTAPPPTMTKTDTRRQGYGPRELGRFRLLLLGLKEELFEEIREMRDPATQLEYVERATVLHNRSKTLELIERALERIEEHRYGICTSCGELIEEGRLEALPYTQLCVSCKSGTAKRGEGNGARGQAA